MEKLKKKAEEDMLQADQARKEIDKQRVIAEEKARRLSLIAPPTDEEEAKIKKHPIAIKAEKRASISLQSDDRLTSPRRDSISLAIAPITATTTPSKMTRANTAPVSSTPLSPTMSLLQQIAAKSGKETAPVSEVKEEKDFLDLDMSDISSYF
jgi:hypothetical protein